MDGTTYHKEASTIAMVLYTYMSSWISERKRLATSDPMVIELEKKKKTNPPIQKEQRCREAEA